MPVVLNFIFQTQTKTLFYKFWNNLYIPKGGKHFYSFNVNIVYLLNIIDLKSVYWNIFV